MIMGSWQGSPEGQGMSGPENANIKVFVNKRLRPIRLAFLVPVSSPSALRTALEIASSVWGGRFCALLPVFGRTPKSWADPPFKPPAARVILRGYIKAFEPDFVVNLTSQSYTEEALGLDGEDRIISLDKLFDETKSEVAAYGVGLGAILDSLYSKIFRFQLRHPPNVDLARHRRRATRALPWCLLRYAARGRR